MGNNKKLERTLIT